MQNRCVLVLGMHRGGTSAFAGTLQALGVEFGDDLLPGQVENPLGFFEDRTVVRVNDDILDAVGSFWCDPLPDLDASEWDQSAQKLLAEAASRLGTGFGHASLWGLKDPRICRLLPLWLPLLTRLESTPCSVIAVRHPAEVAASLVARNRMEPKNAQLLWLEHLLDAEVNTRGMRRVFVTYDALMNDWRGTVASMAFALGFAWPHSPEESAVADQVDQFLRPALRHHYHHDDQAGTVRTAAEVYGLFKRLAELPAGSAEAESIFAALDEHRQHAREWSWQHTEENVRLRRERHQAQNIIESYEAEINGLRADRELVVADRAKAQEIIEIYGAELSRLRNEVETVLKDRRQAQTVIDENQAELSILLSDRAALKADRAKAQEILEVYEGEIKALRTDRELVVAERVKAQEILEAYEREIKVLRADREFVLADRRKAQDIMEAQAFELEGLHAERANIVADRSKAQEVLEAQETEIESLSSEKETLVTDCREARQTLEIQAAIIETLRSEREILGETHYQMQATIQAQTDELIALHEEARLMRESPRHAMAAAFDAARRYLKLEGSGRG